MTSIVYLIGSPETDESADRVKIGRTTNLKRRLAALQTGSSYELEVWATMNGGADLEGVLHAHFADRRGNGEWFNFSGAGIPVTLIQDLLTAARNVVQGAGLNPAQVLAVCQLGRSVNDDPDELNRRLELLAGVDLTIREDDELKG